MRANKFDGESKGPIVDCRRRCPPMTKYALRVVFLCDIDVEKPTTSVSRAFGYDRLNVLNVDGNRRTAATLNPLGHENQGMRRDGDKTSTAT